MKKLSDYQGEDAIDLWCDIIEPMTTIFSDREVVSIIRSRKAPFVIAKEIISAHKQEAMQIVLRVDPTPIDGVNLITRIVSIVLEFINSPDLKGFFTSAGQAKMEGASTGNAMASTEGAEN